MAFVSIAVLTSALMFGSIPVRDALPVPKDLPGTIAAESVLWEQLPHFPYAGSFPDLVWTDLGPPPLFDFYSVSDASTAGATWNVTRVTVWFTNDTGSWLLGDAVPPAFARLSVFSKSGSLPVDGIDEPGEYIVPITVVLDGGISTHKVSADTSAVAELQGITGDFWIGLTPVATEADNISGTYHEWEHHVLTAVGIGDPSASLNPGGGWGYGTDWFALPSVDWPDMSIRLEGEVLTPDPWTNLGRSLAGTSGSPALVGAGPLTVGSAGSLDLTNARPSAFTILFVAGGSTPVPFKGGTLCAFPFVGNLLFTTSALGTIELAWAAWGSELTGVTLVFQYAIQDPAAINGVALSNAVQADVP